MSAAGSAPVPARTLLCFGDSNTHGANARSPERFARDVRWPGVLQRQLGPAWYVVEEGLGGRTTIFDEPFKEGRNGRPYLAACLESHQPVDLLAIMLGTNDLKAIYGNTPQTIAQGMSTLVRLARRSETGHGGRAPALLVVAPAPLGPITASSELWGFSEAIEASRELARLYQLIAEQEGAQFLDAGAVAEVDPADGVHLTAESHWALGSAVAARVAEWFPPA